MSDYLIPSPSSWNKADAYAMADDAGDWACEHIPRVGRLDLEDLDNSLREKRTDPESARCSGEPCKHGQVACPIAGACHAPEEDQTLSADRDAFWFFVKFYGSILLGVLALHFVLAVLKGAQP